MMGEILKRMSGEELLLMSILQGSHVQADVDAELDRRALSGTPRRRAVRTRAALAWQLLRAPMPELTPAA